MYVSTCYVVCCIIQRPIKTRRADFASWIPSEAILSLPQTNMSSFGFSVNLSMCSMCICLSDRRKRFKSLLIRVLYQQVSPPLIRLRLVKTCSEIPLFKCDELQYTKERAISTQTTIIVRGNCIPFSPWNVLVSNRAYKKGKRNESSKNIIYEHPSTCMFLGTFDSFSRYF